MPSSSHNIPYFESLTSPLRERKTFNASQEDELHLLHMEAEEVLSQPHELRIMDIVIWAVFGASVCHVNKVTDLLNQPLCAFLISRLKQFIVSILTILNVH